MAVEGGLEAVAATENPVETAVSIAAVEAANGWAGS